MNFCSKILLFGEYTSMMNRSWALSLPFANYTGQFAIAKPKIQDSNILESQQEVRLFFEDLQLKVDDLSSQATVFDFKTFSDDLDRGLFFDSSIPKGYGIGSSGALVAATYSKYCINPIPNHPIQFARYFEVHTRNRFLNQSN